MRVAEINITPLIDVMLVLLILFMVIAPARTRSLETAVPKPATDAGASPPIVVTVDSTGYSVNRIPAGSLDEARERLRELFRTGSHAVVLVEVRGDPSYARVVEALDLAEGAGATRLGLR